MNKLSPFLWFDNQAEQAAKFYTELFPDSRITRIVPYYEGAPMEKPSDTLTVEFEIFGKPFVALNGGPMFTFSEAVSFVIHCDSQEEVDRYWQALGEGRPGQCGWIKDRFGLSWQVVPRVLDEYLADSDPQKAQRVFSAMITMEKMDIAALEKAHRGE